MGCVPALNWQTLSRMEKINRNLIAPCGMNCGICAAYLRKKNACAGCNKIEADSPKTRVSCRIRICPQRRGKYCHDCADYPCDRLMRLDKRYRARYGMSEIENLEFIRARGVNEFIKRERRKWQSARGVFCVHDRKHY